MSSKPTGAGRSSFDLIDAAALFDELKLNRHTTFLDAACGRGAYSIAAARRIGAGGKVYAVDLWQEGIEALQKEIRTLGIGNAEAVVADVSKRIPVDDHTIEVCLLATVLHDLTRDNAAQGALIEVKRVLKPGGMLAVVEFKKIDGPPGPPIGVRLAPQEVEKQLEPHAFEVTKTRDIGAFNYLSLFQNR